MNKKKNNSLFYFLAVTVIILIQSIAGPPVQKSTAQNIVESVEVAELPTNLFPTLSIEAIQDQLDNTQVEESTPIEVVEEPAFEVIEEVLPVYAEVTAHYLNVRSDSNADAQIIDVLPNGFVVEVSSVLDNGWIQISTGGFVNSNYIQETTEKTLADNLTVSHEPDYYVPEIDNIFTSVSTDDRSVVSPIEEGILSVSNLTVDEIESVLEGTKMHNKGIAEAALKVEAEYGINALVTIAVARLESWHGKSKIAQDKNNYFGLNAIDGAAYKNAFTYDTPGDSVMAFGKLIKNNYIDKGYDTLTKINKKYSSNSEWKDKVATLITADINKL